MDTQNPSLAKTVGLSFAGSAASIVGAFAGLAVVGIAMDKFGKKSKKTTTNKES